MIIIPIPNPFSGGINEDNPIKINGAIINDKTDAVKIDEKLTLQRNVNAKINATNRYKTVKMML